MILSGVVFFLNINNKKNTGKSNKYNLGENVNYNKFILDLNLYVLEILSNIHMEICCNIISLDRWSPFFFSYMLKILLSNKLLYNSKKKKNN